ncbi:hypothetical protein [Bdellovibrio sp. HCB-110]|uniref:hypothetical protein n=1 Tax=Bdellovibrio sp. HCB-110 TaxID=3391182 RepID=UPI0039B6D41C
MNCIDYHDALKKLYEEEPDNVVVSHNPMTDRYNRAYENLEALINTGEALGYTERVPGDVIELVLFCEAKDFDKNNSMPGEYGVFRFKFVVHKETVFADVAELFAFYDGEPSYEDQGNQAIYEVDEAEKLLNQNGHKSCW